MIFTLIEHEQMEFLGSERRLLMSNLKVQVNKWTIDKNPIYKVLLAKHAARK
jgi:hypothetical protein